MKVGGIVRIFSLFLLCMIWIGCSEEEVDPTIVESEYRLDEQLFEIDTRMFWRSATEPGSEDQLRLLQEVSEDGETDMIVVIPVVGSGKLAGSYIYSKTGDIRTYDVVYVRNIENEKSFEWITNGNSGTPLTIVRAGTENGEPIYTIQIEDFELNYGYYDFLGDKWISLGLKKFSFQYQGVIEKP